MTEPVDTQSAPAYTRGSVVNYLRAAEAERQQLERAIAEARARTASVRGRIERLDALGLGTAPSAGGVDFVSTSRPEEPVHSASTPRPEAPEEPVPSVSTGPSTWWSIDIGTSVGRD